MPTENINNLTLILIKGLISLVWLIFLIIGAAAIQQIRQMNIVVQTPGKKIVWTFYLIYVFFALLAFLISIIFLWLA